MTDVVRGKHVLYPVYARAQAPILVSQDMSNASTPGKRSASKALTLASDDVSMVNGTVWPSIFALASAHFATYRGALSGHVFRERKTYSSVRACDESVLAI